MAKNNNLARLREQRGMTQREVAEELHVSRPAVSQWERGEVRPSTENLLALSRLYGVALEELYRQAGAEEEKNNMPLEEADNGQEEGSPPKHGRNWRGKIAASVILAVYICFVVGILWWGKLENSTFLAMNCLILGTAVLVVGWFIFFTHKILQYLMRRNEK